LGFEIKVAPTPSKLKFMINLLRTIRRVDPDVIHTWEGFVTSACLGLAVFHRRRIINFDIQYAHKVRRLSLLYLQERMNLLFSYRNVANSEAGFRTFRVSPSRKNRVIYNGFDPNRIDHAPRIGLRKMLGAEEKKLVAMTASFSAPKDFETLIRAGSNIVSQNRDVLFLFIGEGPRRQKVQDLIDDGCRNAFVFLGQREDVESIVREVDIGVLLSKSGHAEGISNSLMEFMAAGKPVIATDVGGNPELVQEGLCGFLLPHEDVDVLQEKLVSLLRDPEKRNEMGAIGRKRIREKFSMEQMVAQFSELYEECV
jgi:glycosyltransferase involved in cell wall biosynthesis